MPATFPSHQGAVLPLKLWRPQWFDGVALAVGAASPDMAYLLDGSNLPVWPFSHEWLGLLGWCLPVTVVVAWLFRWAAPTVAAHLPVGGPLALRDYGALRNGGHGCRHRSWLWGSLALAPRAHGVAFRSWLRGSLALAPRAHGVAFRSRLRGSLALTPRAHRWWVTGSSAVLGGASHIVLDLVGDPNEAFEYTLHVVGGLITLWVVLEIGRRRLLLAWHGPAPRVDRQPRLFWGVSAPLGVLGFIVVPFLPAAFLQHTTGARLIAVVALALLAGAVAVASRNRAG